MQSKKVKDNNKFQYLLFSVYVGLISSWNILGKGIFCHQWESTKLDNGNIHYPE